MTATVGPGPYSIEVSREPAMPIVLIETSFGLKMRYEADQEFFYLGCQECFGRLEMVMGHEAAVCRECKKEHFQHKNVILMLPGAAHLDDVIQSWAQDYLDSFEVVVTVDALARRLKKIHKLLKKEPDARYKAYDVACRKYSGPLEPS